MKKFKDDQKSQVRRILSDPVLYATHLLGAELWDREAELLRSIQRCRRTAVKACHGAGKTYVLARAALWWLTHYEQGIVLITAPTFRQVKTQLWSEIHRAAARSKCAFPEANETYLKLRGDDNFILGLSTNHAQNFQGYHGKDLLIIADEAPGIASDVWDAIDGTMAGGNVHFVMAGNPTIPSGAFYDAFVRRRALWNCITIDAFDSPNLDGISLEQLLQLDPREGGPLDQNSVPYLVNKRWVYDQYQVWWHGDERSSPSWVSRVRGQFPDQAQNALVNLLWLERARERALETPVADNGARLVAGVDVGGGQSETVVYLCEVGAQKKRIIKFGAWRKSDTRGEVVEFLAPYRDRLATVRVDEIGIGHNFGLHLREQGFRRVELVNVSLPCNSQPNLGENNPAIRFTNLKAQYYRNLANFFQHDEIDGLTDDVTIAQLAGIIYEIDPRGRLKIEAKEKARARGATSPDRAEALMLALGEPPAVIEYTSAASLRTPRSERDRFDQDDPGFARRRKRTRWDSF
jgi:hypothetical protein